MEWLCDYCGSANIGFHNCEKCGAPSARKPMSNIPITASGLFIFDNNLVVGTGMIMRELDRNYNNRELVW